MDVLVGAGGLIEPDDQLAARFDVGMPKAMLPLAGRPMVQWVLDAIAGSTRLTRVFVGGLDSRHGLSCGGKPVTYLKREAGIVESVVAGARAMQASGATTDRALWVGGDLPLVRAEMLDWFATRVEEGEHDFYVPAVDRGLMRRRFPDARRTALRFKDGAVCIGDVYGGDTRAALGAVDPMWKRIAAARKHPLEIAARVGVWPLLLLATRQMTTSRALRVARERFGFDATLLDCPWAEIGMDVDKPAHFDVAARELEGAA